MPFSPSLPSSPQIFLSTHCGVGTVLDIVTVNKTGKTALGAYIQAGGMVMGREINKQGDFRYW